MSELMRDPQTGKYYRDDEMGRLVEVPAYVVEQGPIDAALIATGETLTNVGRRVGGLFGMDTEPLPGDVEAMQQLREERPVATTVGDMLPALATIPLSGGLAAQAGIGAVTGGLLEGTPEAVVYGAAGGALGDVAGRVLQRAGRAVAELRTPRTPTAAASRLEAAGGRLTPAQRSGSTSMKQVEAQIESTATGGRFMDEIGEANKQAMRERAGRALGAGVDDVSPGSLAAAGDDIARQFEGVGGDIGRIELDEGLLKEIDNIAQDIKHIDDSELRGALARIKEAKPGAAPQPVELNGSTLMEMRTELTGRIADAKSPALVKRLGKAMDRLDALVERQAGPEVAARYETARKRYQLWSVLMESGSVKEGDVMLGTVANKLRRTYGPDYARVMGEIDPRMGEFGELTQAASAREFVNEFGRSGTAERSQNLLEGLMREPIYRRYFQGEGNVGAAWDALTGQFEPGVLDELLRQSAAGMGRAGGVGLAAD